MDTVTFAYYCSGHGYGHATRVSAFARHLLSLRLNRRIVIHIVSSAPQHVFADSLAHGALYRHAEIDPVIVQPLAYRVDRQKSLDVLQAFLAKKDVLLDRERSWLLEVNATCVLSDAAFLGCLAAKAAGIPSVLITNFTFDSVYSYLATSLVDAPSPAPASPSPSTRSLSPPSTPGSSNGSDLLLPDDPIPEHILAPLVAQLHDGYRHADLLLRLPGQIPIPSFFIHPSLPSPQWVDPCINRFYDHVTQYLSPLNMDTLALHPPIPFPNSDTRIPRSVRPAPLLVRPPSPGIYTPEGRAAFLQKTGLPDFKGMKILVVSFGGQLFKRPNGSRSVSRNHSRNASQEQLTLTSTDSDNEADPTPKGAKSLQPVDTNNLSLPYSRNGFGSKSTSRHVDLEAVNKGLRLYTQDSGISKRKHRNHRRSFSSHRPSHRPFFHEDSHSNATESDTSRQQESDQDGAADFKLESTADAQRRHTLPRRYLRSLMMHRRALATSSHILIPGAPGPATKPANAPFRSSSLGKYTHRSRNRLEGHSPLEETGPIEICMIPPTPLQTTSTDPQYHNIIHWKGPTNEESERVNGIIPHPQPPPRPAPRLDAPDQEQQYPTESGTDEEEEGLLPDENWIAVICGVSKEQWNDENGDSGLPEGFYVAPRDVYMPDLIAVSDVVLGKLGYGMTSECVDACTPFVYVSRPLFIEEHGLRLYLEKEGVGLELARDAYENGEWGKKIEEAYLKGRRHKEAKLQRELEFHVRLQKMEEGGIRNTGNGTETLSEREREGRETARGLVGWLDGVRELMENDNRLKSKPSLTTHCLVPQNSTAIGIAEGQEILVN